MINATTTPLKDLPNGEELRAKAQKDFNLTDAEAKSSPITNSTAISTRVLSVALK